VTGVAAGGASAAPPSLGTGGPTAWSVALLCDACWTCVPPLQCDTHVETWTWVIVCVVVLDAAGGGEVVGGASGVAGGSGSAAGGGSDGDIGADTGGIGAAGAVATGTGTGVGAVVAGAGTAGIGAGDTGDAVDTGAVGVTGTTGVLGTLATPGTVPVLDTVAVPDTPAGFRAAGFWTDGVSPVRLAPLTAGRGASARAAAAPVRSATAVMLMTTCFPYLTRCIRWGWCAGTPRPRSAGGS
jgi:hypothetical protein